MDEYDTYCIRCGKPLRSDEVRYSKDDPDCEEALCADCYKHYEKMKESED